jgi:hypothetical protein
MAADPQDYATASPFPPAIGAAIVKVMKALGTLGKDNENKFDHYDYASIDDFIGHVREHCADAGLFIVPNEARDAETQEVSKKDGKPMVVWSARFAFILVHESGEAFGPIYKSVSVQFNGAQASGSSQSYALKQLMRGLFLIKTGDKDDPDKSGIEIASKGEHQTDLQKLAGAIRKRIREASDLSELGLRWSDSELDLELIKGASETAFDFLQREYDNRKRELQDA